MEFDDFDIDKCTHITYINLSENLKERISSADLKKIIYLELEFLKMNGIFSNESSANKLPIEIDGNMMGDYIIENAANYDGIKISDEDYDEIIEAEYVYYKTIDSSWDEGEHFN